MAAILTAGLPKLGLEPDEDVVSYLVELLETEGVDSCAEWLESASNGEHSDEAKLLAEEAFASIKNAIKEEDVQSSSPNVNNLKIDSYLDESIGKSTKSSVKWPVSLVGSSQGQPELKQLDSALKREIVQRYACVEVQTLHLDEYGQFYSSGVAINNLEQDVEIPSNTNAARVRQEQHELRLSQKQKHLEEQEKLRQQKIKQQQRDEKERLRCQKKERHK